MTAAATKTVKTVCPTQVEQGGTTSIKPAGEVLTLDAAQADKLLAIGAVVPHAGKAAAEPAPGKA